MLKTQSYCLVNGKTKVGLALGVSIDLQPHGHYIVLLNYQHCSTLKLKVCQAPSKLIFISLCNDSVVFGMEGVGVFFT